MALRAERVSVKSQQSVRLDAVDLCLQAGEVIALIGPNGAGKSSLLRCLAGEWRPSSGEVSLDDRALALFTPRELAQKRVMLPQQASLAFPLSVEEVVRLGRSPYAAQAAQDMAVVNTALVVFSLSALAGRAYNRLSGGEQQRVQLARVWAQLAGDAMHTPRYALLDEPQTGLDLNHQMQLMAAIRELAAQGVGVLMVVHDLSLASRFADELVLMNKGRVVAQAAPKDLLETPQLAEVYGVAVELQPLRDPQAVGVSTTT